MTSTSQPPSVKIPAAVAEKMNEYTLSLFMSVDPFFCFVRLLYRIDCTINGTAEH